MSNKQKFSKSILKNNNTYMYYYTMFSNLAVNRFKWKNLPPTVDERFLNVILFEQGKICFFEDEILGYVVMQVTEDNRMDIYNRPVKRQVYAVSGYQRQLDISNSVIIYENYLRVPAVWTILEYCDRLMEIQRTIDTNVWQQKTPKVIVCEESQRLTIENFMKQYSDNETMILGNKNLTLNPLDVMDTSAPAVFPHLQIQKMYYINEVLTFLGIENANESKRERLITDEVSAGLGIIEAQRYVSLNNLRQACREINAMFGLDIEVEYNSEMTEILTPEFLSSFEERKERIFNKEGNESNEVSANSNNKD